MIKPVILGALGSAGYFVIQYFGGWMIFMPGLQQGSVTLLGIFLCFIASKLLRLSSYLLSIFICPILSFSALFVLKTGDLGMLYGVSFLNLIAYATSVVISSNLFTTKEADKSDLRQS